MWGCAAGKNKKTRRGIAVPDGWGMQYAGCSRDRLRHRGRERRISAFAAQAARCGAGKGKRCLHGHHARQQRHCTRGVRPRAGHPDGALERARQRADKRTVRCVRCKVRADRQSGAGLFRGGAGHRAAPVRKRRGKRRAGRARADKGRNACHGAESFGCGMRRAVCAQRRHCRAVGSGPRAGRSRRAKRRRAASGNGRHRGRAH